MAYRILYSDGVYTEQAWKSKAAAQKILDQSKYIGRIVFVDVRKAPRPNTMWKPTGSPRSGVYQVRSTKSEMKRRLR